MPTMHQNPIIRRDSIVLIVVLMLFMALIAKAVHVQIIQAEFLQNEGNKRQIRTLDIPAPRGEILDRNGNVLALSTPIDSIWVDPKTLAFYLDPVAQQTQLLSENLTPAQLQKRQQTIEKKYRAYQQMLSILELSPSTFTPQVLAKRERRFMYVKRGVLPELTAKIEALDVPGLYVQNQYKRYYPAGEVVSHLIGFTNIDDVGIAGIEKTYDAWLSGQAGKKQIVKDRAGRVVEFVKDLQPAKPGKQIHLSIDKDIQFFLYHAMKKSFIQHQATSMMSVILDAKTAEVIAMVSLPAFNPNDRSQLQGERLRNRVVTDVMEPGSPTKPFIIAKALDLGVLDIHDKINTSPGSMVIQGQRITDTRNHGTISPAEVIQYSSNIGASKIAFRMTPQQQWQMFHDVGFGQDLGLFLPGETMGYIRPAAEWQKIDQASSSFGYGFNINLMQLAHAYMVISNQGQLRPLSVIQRQSDQENMGKQIISADVAQQVLEMMEAVVAKGGTAPQAKVEGYRVAGKTGTVHLTKAGGYEANQYLSLFAGIVPVSDPQYIMVTAVNKPSRGIYYGGKVAAPIFKEVMTDVLRLKNIVPDDVWQGG